MKFLDYHRDPQHPRAQVREPEACISGQILQGLNKPTDCTLEHPLGATMVSTEGACSAYHRYQRRHV